MKKGVDMAIGNPRGVTLIELLIVLAIIGILVLVGFNTMSTVIPKHRVNAAVNDMTSRLRAAKMLSVVHNQAVTIIVDTATNSYHACIDSNRNGDCSDEVANGYLNLDSGRKSSLGLAEKKHHPLVEIYNVAFSGSTPTALTYNPPSGLPEPITDAGGALINGSICFRAEVDEGAASITERFAFRRISINPVVGTVAAWKAKNTGVAPACGSADTDWEKM